MNYRKVRSWMTAFAGMLIGSAACLQDYVRADLVNWGGNYVSGSQLLQGNIFSPPITGSDKYGDPATEGNYSGRLVIPETAYSPATGYDTNAPSAVFYGGHVVTWETPEGNTGLTNLSVTNQGTSNGDAIEIEVKPKGQITNYASLFFWKKANFLDGFSSIGPTLADVTLNLRVTQASANKPIGDQVRWVVKSGGLFYISEVAVDLAPNDEFGFQSGGLASLAWMLYEPVNPTNTVSSNPVLTGLSRIFAPSGAFLAATMVSALNDLEAVGFYLESGEPRSGVDIKIKGFSARVASAPVSAPEPGFAVVGVFGVGCFAVRQLRSRKMRSSAGLMSQSSAVRCSATVP